MSRDSLIRKRDEYLGSAMLADKMITFNEEYEDPEQAAYWRRRAEFWLERATEKVAELRELSA